MSFQISRLIKLLRIEVTENFLKSFLVVGLVFVGLMTIGIIGDYLDDGKASLDLYALFTSVTLIGGAIIGSSSFEELNKRHSRVNYLNLPASALEKVLSKGIVNIIIYPIAMFLIFLVARTIFQGIDAIHLEGSFPLKPKYLIAAILFTISIFFYGSVRFNTLAFPKTIALVLGFALILAAFTFITSYAIFPELREAIAGQRPSFLIHGGDLERHWILDLYRTSYFIAPLLFITLSVFCLKEKEG